MKIQRYGYGAFDPSRTQENRIVRQDFDSVASLIEACDASIKTRGVHGSKAGYEADAGGVTREYFIGRKFNNWQDVADASNGVWEEGMKIIQDMINQILNEGRELPAPRDRRRKRRFNDDTGDSVDYDRLRSGQSDYWEECSRQQVQGPQTVTLITNIGGNCNLKPTELLWRGAASIVIADYLERNGYRVELYAVWTSSALFQTQEDYAFSMCCKQAQDPVDVAAMINVLSGWFYRTVIFQSPYNCKPMPKQDLGFSKSISKEGTPVLAEIVKENIRAIVVDHVWDKDRAIALVQKVINDVNENKPTDAIDERGQYQ